jgi:Fe-Mn family superoxide dismutase
MQYQLAPLFCRPWTLNGITPRLIESHYERNYGGELRRLNAISRELERSTRRPRRAAARTPEARRGARAQFDAAARALLRQPGRRRPRRAEAMAGALDPRLRLGQGVAPAVHGAGRRPAERLGLVLLAWLPRDRRLFNVACSEGTPGLAGGVPILAIDLYEHAYHIDFGANVEAYIAAFMRNIDWAAVQGRYEDATKVAPPRTLEQKEFGDVPPRSAPMRCSDAGIGRAVQIIDARPRHYSTARRGHHGRRGVARSERLRLDRRAQARSAGRHLLRLRLPHRLPDRRSPCARQDSTRATWRGGHYGWKAIGGKTRQFGEG